MLSPQTSPCLTAEVTWGPEIQEAAMAAAAAVTVLVMMKKCDEFL